MKIVRILGGLGNQMFQYAFYKALQAKNIKALTDISFFKTYGLHNGYELERIFNIRLKSPSKLQLALLKPDQRKWKYRKLKSLFLLKNSYREEPVYFQFDSSFLNPKGHHYYWGYWQNEKYFKEIRDTILHDFTFPPLKNSRNIEISNEIKSSESVSVHIRRSDYLKEEGFGNVCDLKYYETAISRMQNEFGKLHFFVFSDDISWCKENIKLDNVKFIDWNTGPNSYIDMQLMSYCKHNIIANSSFSWWGAWLNQNPEKKVIAPLTWMKGSSLTLALEEWTKI